jgi:hypothetical protein
MAVEFRTWNVIGVSLHTRTLWDVCRCPCHLQPGTPTPEGHQCCVTCPRCNYHIEDMMSHQTYCT